MKLSWALHNTSMDSFRPLPSALEMQRFDAVAQAALDDETVLMRRAGLALASEITFRTANKEYVVFVGPGNNGGDGLVLARLLLERGFSVRVIAAATGRCSKLWSQMAFEYISAGGRLERFGDGSLPCERIPFGGVASCRVTKVDALLGNGQQAAPRAAVAQLVECLRLFSGPTISIDVPTGVDCSTGGVFEPCVKADLTLTIEHPKRGMLQFPARDCVGSLVVLPIGIGAPTPTESVLVTRDGVRALVQERTPNSHKGTYGHVCVIGGSRDMPGAVTLSAAAALRSGAGKVTIASVAGVSVPGYPELMYTVLDQGPTLGPGFNLKLDHFQAVLLGPGLGRRIEAHDFVREVVATCVKNNLPLVLDADALFCLANLQELELPSRVVLTPHPGEAACLLGLSTSEVQADRYRAVAALQAKFLGSIVILKGRATVVANGERIFTFNLGKQNLATAGTGDVLSGIIVGLLAQGYAEVSAALLGTYLHCLTSEKRWRETQAPSIASDFIGQIDSAWNELLK